jgi:hypothetical protein
VRTAHVRLARLRRVSDDQHRLWGAQDRHNLALLIDRIASAR